MPMQSSRYQSVSSTLPSSSLSSDESTTDFITYLETDTIARVIAFVYSAATSNTVYGGMYGRLFAHYAHFTLLLFIMTYSSFMTMLDVISVSPSFSTDGILITLLATNIRDDTWPLINSFYVLAFCSWPPIGIIFCASIYAESKRTCNKSNDLKCIKLLNAIFSFEWNYTAKLDTEYFQTTVARRLKTHDSIPSQTENLDGKIDWFPLVVFTASSLILIHFIIRSTLISGLFFTDHPLILLEVPLLICIFNFLGKKLLYYYTSEVPVPKRDSFRLWFMLTLKLCLLTSPISLLFFYADCFPVVVGAVILYLFLLTFVFDAVVPFIWYNWISSKLEKPLFDLPLSQANVHYYYVLSLIAQFYVPTFGLVSLPLVYLQGKCLFHRLKWSRLPSATYNEDQWKSCVIPPVIISFSYVFMFLFTSLFVTFPCGYFKNRRLMDVGWLLTPWMMIVYAAILWFCIYLYARKILHKQLKVLFSLRHESTNVLLECSKRSFKEGRIHGV
ncbi:hypothetical protein GEMRC1_000732 [Eukaryota sp. GEM-RC1]